MVKINGQKLNEDGKTIAQYLSSIQYNISRIAVEKNGEIVPKSKYNEVIMESGDVIEVVSFVGGG